MGAHIRLRLLVGRSMVCSRRMDAADVQDFYATTTDAGGYLGGYQTADGCTTLGSFVRSGCRAAGVEVRELQEYSEDEIDRLCDYVAGTVAQLDQDYRPHLPAAFSMTWQDALAHHLERRGDT